jgi:ABC-type protease/lipase transport system fused ATPase/permease subunit
MKPRQDRVSASRTRTALLVLAVLIGLALVGWVLLGTLRYVTLD